MSDDAATPGDQAPYLTLAQLVKLLGAAESGGQAKHKVRAGGMLVNGVAENRPGRKLRAGDIVTIDGAEHVVELN